MTTTQAADQQQAQLEQLVTRIAQRAADNVAESVADLGRKLALAQETIDGQAAVLQQLQKDAEDKDAELARAHQVSAELRQRVQDLTGQLEAAQPGAAPDSDDEASGSTQAD